MLIVVLVLFLQALGPQAYTAADEAGQFYLAMENGLYTINLGAGCETMAPGLNVEWLAGSGNVGGIVPVGTDEVCNVYISGKVNDTPCAMTEDGVCDIGAQG